MGSQKPEQHLGNLLPAHTAPGALTPQDPSHWLVMGLPQLLVVSMTQLTPVGGVLGRSVIAVQTEP